MPLPRTFAPAYDGAIKTALIIQVACAVLLLMLLDGGRMAKIGGCAMAGFWLLALVIFFRRPQNPKPLDLLYLRWGYVALLGVAFVAAEFIHPDR
jgi:hypothetical protein